MRIRDRVLDAADRRLRRACDRLPAEAGEERYREWSAELPAILDDPDVRPAAVRWVCTWLFAADQTRTVRNLTTHPTLLGRLRHLLQNVGSLDGRWPATFGSSAATLAFAVIGFSVFGADSNPAIAAGTVLVPSVVWTIAAIQLFRRRS